LIYALKKIFFDVDKKYIVSDLFLKI